MHELQPKTTKLKVNEIKDLVEKYNISLAQLPRMKSTDPNLPQGSSTGDVVKIERKGEDSTEIYYRVIA